MLHFQMQSLSLDKMFMCVEYKDLGVISMEIVLFSSIIYRAVMKLK